MAFFNHLLGAEGCNVDGTVSNNPFTSLLDSAFQHQHGPYPGMMGDGDMDPGMAESAAFMVGQDNALSGMNNDVGQPVMQTAGGFQQMPSQSNSMGMGQMMPMMIPPPMMMMPSMMPMGMYGGGYMMPGHTQHNYQMDTNEYIPNIHSPQQQHQQQQHLYSESDVQDSTAGVESKTDWQEALGPSQTGYDEAWEDLKSRLESGALGGDAQTSSSDYQFSSGNDYFQAMSNDIIAAEQLSASTNSNHTEDIIDGMFEKAMDLYRAGKLRDAVLAFEAVVQHERGKEHDEAWRMLGTCHAENDEDKKAIQCLNKALKCDPYNLDALLSLGTSYVNELDSVRALQTLRTWVSHNPRFQGLEVVQDEYSDGTLMDEVMQLMLAVAEFSPSDPQVQVVLGVLYNVSLDYDSAVECFTKAMAENQSDYSVINKLAASYANNNQSDLAIPHYAKVLELRPTFARGWLNLGISHANMDQYDQAARSYLQALHLNPAAKHIWGYLRVVLASMDRLDLVEVAGREDISSLAEQLGVELLHLS